MRAHEHETADKARSRSRKAEEALAFLPNSSLIRVSER